MLGVTFDLSSLLTSGLSTSSLLFPLDTASSDWPGIFGRVLLLASLSVLAAVAWALLERFERRTLREQNDRLSTALMTVTEQHYRERLQAEERHLMTHDSSMRNVLESLERSLLGKPKL